MFEWSISIDRSNFFSRYYSLSIEWKIIARDENSIQLFHLKKRTQENMDQSKFFSTSSSLFFIELERIYWYLVFLCLIRRETHFSFLYLLKIEINLMNMWHEFCYFLVGNPKAFSLSLSFLPTAPFDLRKRRRNKKKKKSSRIGNFWERWACFRPTFRTMPTKR